MQAWGRMRLGKPTCTGFDCPDGVWVGSNGLEVMRPFWASLAGMSRNHDDRALRPDTLLVGGSRNWISTGGGIRLRRSGG
jgi:hypothetical protein